MSLKQLLEEAISTVRKYQNGYEFMRNRHGELYTKTLDAKANLWLAKNKVQLLRQKISRMETAK